MKLRRFLSVMITTAVVMTNAVGIITANAETVNLDAEYSEDFGTYTTLNYQKTLKNLKDYGWYMADHETLYDNVDTVAPYSTYNYKLAKIVTKDGSNCLQIVSPGEINSTSDANVPNYGYGKTFPGVAAGEAVTGSWEINFDFKPYVNTGAKNTTQFAFTLNTGDGSASSETAACHNIVAGYGQRFYLGYRDYKQLLNGNVTQGTLKAVDIGGEAWYKVKTVLNCDARYYSVELYNAAGKLLARRSPISFAADESIGFLKFSALGMKQDSWVYVDNISIKKIAENRTIYNETFDTFTNDSYAAKDGMTTGGVSEDFGGNSYFEGYTPWRFHSDIGNSYALEPDDANSGKVVRLGDKGATKDNTEASGLVYMQASDSLQTQETEQLRGKLKTSFKIKPETIVNDVTVNVIPNFSSDITDDNCAYFKITDNDGTPQFVKASGECVDLDASEWYDAELVFDTLNRTVATAVKDTEGNDIADSLMEGNTVPDAVKAVMFKVDGGSSVLVDDIKLEYLPIAPSVDTSKIVLTDRFGEEITDINNVAASLKTIEIPMGCPINGETAAISVQDSNKNTISYTGSVSGDSYIIELNDVLGLNKEYTVTIPQTLASTAGVTLGENVVFTFRTLNAVIDIGAVSVNDAPFSCLSDITAGSEVSVLLSYANNTAEAVNSKVVLAFYGDGKLVGVDTVDFTVPSGAYGTNGEPESFTVPEDINMVKVDSMSMFIWDGLRSIKPLSRNIKITRKIGETGKYRDYVDFEVNIESGRDAVILQLTDPQIIDSMQVREGVAYSQEKKDFWQPVLMHKRLFKDLKALIETVNPDLILLTGDLVYGGYDDEGTSFRRLANFMDGFDIPWAPVFGNHDNESEMGVDWQCQYLENCKNCLFKQRTLTGNGNYSIGIVQGGELKRVIFMLDSNGCAVMSDESFANGHSKKSVGFGEDQIAWYTGAAQKINRDFANIKYTFAFHIQPAVFEDALATYGFDNDAATVPDGVGKGDFVAPINIDEHEDKRATDFGYIGRKLKTPWDSDKTVYNGMKAIGADSILVGHEHCNSASVVYDGVRFQYGQKIGEYDRINFSSASGNIIGMIAFATETGTPVLGGTVMKLSESTGAISDAYIQYCDK